MTSWIGNTIYGGFNAHFQIADEDKTVLSNGRYYYDYRMRNPCMNRQATQFYELWPSSQMMSGDPTVPMAMLGSNDAGGFADSFEPWHLGEGGNYRPQFVYGNCIDANSNPLAGVTVDLFLTSTNLLVSTSLTDSQGNYQAPTPYSGQNHYVVAYLTGATPVAGTSVNTLTPSN